MKLTEAQRKLVEENVGLINVHIRRFVSVPRNPNRQREYADLYQEGALALMQAAKTYDASRHGVFAAYAIPRIHHGISLALYERFATVRVPAKSVKRAKKRRGGGADDPRHRPEPALIETHGLGNVDGVTRDGHGRRHRPIGGAASSYGSGRAASDTAAARLRTKYEAAVREAADRLTAARRGRDDRSELVRRIVDERLFIPEPDARIAKRQLARDFRCSIGRVQTCEEALTSEVRALLEADEEFNALMKLARDSHEGLEVAIDPPMAARLHRVAVEGFARRFAHLPPERQAMVLRDLVRSRMASLTGFAARLFAALDARGCARFLGQTLPMRVLPRQGRTGQVSQ